MPTAFRGKLTLLFTKNCNTSLSLTNPKLDAEHTPADRNTIKDMPL